MSDSKPNKIANVLSVLAIIFSMLALLVSWAAYNKYGQDLQQAVIDELSKIQNTVAIEMAKLETRARLLSIETEVKSQSSYDELAVETSHIRQDLQADYANLKGAAREEWQEIDNSLAVLENDLRSNSIKAAESLRSSLDVLDRKIRIDIE